MRRLLVLLVVLAALVAPARAEIMDKLDEVAGEVPCTKWWGPDATRVDKMRGRIVVLHFSRPERLLSQGAMGTLRKLHDTYKDRSVTVVEVVVSPEERTAADYVVEKKPAWSVGHDGGGTAAMKWPGDSLPRTYLIGPDGRVVYHMHVAAFTDAVMKDQVDRLPLFDPSPQLKAGKAAQRAVAEGRYRAALEECDKIDKDERASDADRALVKAIRAEIPRQYDFLLKRAEKLTQERDYGLALRRYTRMMDLFKGTAYGPDVVARVDELRKQKIFDYVCLGQEKLDELMSRPLRTPKQVRDVIGEIDRYLESYGETIPGERAARYREGLVAQLGELEARR